MLTEHSVDPLALDQGAGVVADVGVDLGQPFRGDAKCRHERMLSGTLPEVEGDVDFGLFDTRRDVDPLIRLLGGPVNGLRKPLLGDCGRRQRSACSEEAQDGQEGSRRSVRSRQSQLTTHVSSLRRM